MQGFNMGRYVPPDQEGTSSGNQLHGKHALGGRASKLASHGILTVRFEMPFAIWCASCPQPTVIGQGVRFNAQKQRVGAYHSTPIWSFRMRHAACGGAIEMRTDPQHTAYVVVAGAAKRDTGPDVNAGDKAILSDAERDALRKNAFASLEKTIDDREQLKQATERIDDLEAVAAQHWDDPYTQNQRLRRAFRAGRKERERDAAAGEALKEKLSLGIDLVPATEDDARHAALVDFGPADDARDRALSKPLFGNTAGPRAGSEVERRRATLVSEVMGNSRAAKDPFLKASRGTEGRASPRLPGVKRKRTVEDERHAARPKVSVQEPSAGLVNYESD
ncbi:hypothetical protein G7046_g9554 [Stylonectria norvegica]|nr:hypothetical protein G7046_g9554 [Stylonectria norvegica]